MRNAKPTPDPGFCRGLEIALALSAPFWAAIIVLVCTGWGAA